MSYINVLGFFNLNNKWLQHDVIFLATVRQSSLKYIKKLLANLLAHILSCPKGGVIDMSFVCKGQRVTFAWMMLVKQEEEKHPLMNMKALSCWGACLNHKGHREYISVVYVSWPQILPEYFWTTCKLRKSSKLVRKHDNCGFSLNLCSILGSLRVF